MKRFMLFIITTFAALALLTGCQGQKLTTTHKTYTANVLAAQIKGNASTKHVTYQINDGKSQTAPVRSNTFSFQVAPATKDQKVTIKAGNHQTQVTVKKVAAIASTATYRKAYNQALTFTALSKEDQQLAKQVQSKKVPLAEQQTTGLKLAKAMQQANSQTKVQQLPTLTEGLHNSLTNNGQTIRTNVQDGQLISAALIIPTSAVKDKAAQTRMAKTFIIMAQSAHADGPKVLKQLTDVFKDAKNNPSSTTSKTISSHGILFDTAFSADNLYLMMTKA